MWQLPPDEVLYLGDCLEIDGAGAAAAGMPCAIISEHRRKNLGLELVNCFRISSFQ
jgi:FMN phosphatase YigB (HAD superfamily)